MHEPNLSIPCQHISSTRNMPVCGPALPSIILQVSIALHSAPCFTREHAAEMAVILAPCLFICFFIFAMK